uniref:Palmitoyltransferase n=1 Tax=Ciona savignyi TaxID=51511 RepID=H2YGF2_CIOSA
STWDIVKATQYGVISRCRDLVEGGYDVRTHDDDNITLLHWAAINNRLELARYYISMGAVVDVLGGDLLATPLHWAIREGHLSMVVLLLQAGADSGIRDAEGCAAIHVAVQCSHTSIVAYLVAKGTDPNLYDANGKTPLMWATWRTYGVDPTRTLLSMHASVNMTDHTQHNTPLHWACLAQNTNVIMLLVQAGANLDAKNDRGETPLDIARMKKNVWITSRLQIAASDKGMDKSRSFFRFAAKKSFRQRATFAISFLSMFCIGFLFELSTPTWLYKGMVCAACYLCIYGLSAFKGFIYQSYKLAIMILGVITHTPLQICAFFPHYPHHAPIQPYYVSPPSLFITQNETMLYLPLAISTATKFWVYCTAIVYYWPHIYSPLAKLWFITASVGMWFFFYKSLRSDPGVVTMAEEQKKVAIIHLAETDGLKSGNICSSCLPSSTITVPWVFNAIGAGNHHYFIGYLFFLLAILGWHIYAAFQFWQHGVRVSSDAVGVEWAWLLMTYSPWVVWIFINCVFHVMWVTVLIICQLYQILWLGVTTNERMNAGRYRHFHTSPHGGLSRSPFDRGVLANFADFFQFSCFGLLKPLSIDWRSK